MIVANEDNEDHLPDRDARGLFLPGNKIGQTTRFPPGKSGNPGGSRNAGATLREWINALADMTIPQLQSVAEDESVPALKNAAAYALLATASSGRDAREAINLIIDRTLGRPPQSVQIQEVTGTDRALAALDACYRSCKPELNGGALPYYEQPVPDDWKDPDQEVEEEDAADVP
jgi:hypothetical protein